MHGHCDILINTLVFPPSAEPIQLAVLLPMTGTWSPGSQIAGAAALAVEQVNQNDLLLPGRVLGYVWADSGCSPQQGLKAIGELLGGTSIVNAVIGPGCSPACEVTSHLSGGQNIPQISWGCTSHVLSDKSKHQLFSRTISPETGKGPALLAFMKHNLWSKVVIFTSTDHFESGLGLKKYFEAYGMEVFKPAAFEAGSFKGANLLEVLRAGFRVILVAAYDEDAKTVATNAAQEGMQLGWAWLLLGSVSRAINDMQGWVCWQPHFPSEGMQSFKEQVSAYGKSHFSLNAEADDVIYHLSAALHDSIVLYAHAATRVLADGGDLHDGQAVAEAIRSTSFEGVGNSVIQLDKQGDPIEV